jgi:hypothetical protein
MSLAGDICWMRTFAGSNPDRVLFGEQQVACSYVDDETYSFVCLDLQGRDCGSLRGFRLEFVLPGERFLGLLAGGGLRVLDTKGREASGIRDGRRAVRCNAVFEVTATSDRVFVKDGREMLVADRALNLIERLPLPASGRGLFVGDGVVYVEDDRVVFSDRSGHPQTLCRIPVAMAQDTMNRWERETGVPALQGVASATIQPGTDLATELVAALTDPSRGTQYGMGDRPQRFQWELGFVEATRTLFLSNFIYPHLIICIGLDGNARWCTYLSSGCCGGLPLALANGSLVVSSGCGGILSWLDASGGVTGRSKPHEGTGLATAYGSEVRGLADSGCIVAGGPGVVAYGADGGLRWIRDEPCSCYDYEEQHDLLVTASWASDQSKKKSVSIQCIKNPGSRASSA